jgi:hypothetical protein
MCSQGIVYTPTIAVYNKGKKVRHAVGAMYDGSVSRTCLAVHPHMIVLRCRPPQVDSFYGSDAQRLHDHLWLHDDA